MKPPLPHDRIDVRKHLRPDRTPGTRIPVLRGGVVYRIDVDMPELKDREPGESDRAYVERRVLEGIYGDVIHQCRLLLREACNPGSSIHRDILERFEDYRTLVLTGRE